MVDWNLSFTPGESLCLLGDYVNYTYSDESIKKI